MIRALGLRARLVLLVLVALAPVFGLVAWTALHNQKEALDSARARLLSQAQLSAAAQERLLDKTRNLLEAVGNVPAIREASPANCTGYFRTLLTQYPAYVSMGLVSPEGELICNSQDARRPLSAEARVLLNRLVAARRFGVGDYQVNAANKRSFVMFAAPIGDPAGPVTSVSYASLGVEAMANALISIPRVEGGETLVTDRNGVVLATYPVRPGLTGTQITDATMLDALHSRRDGVAQGVDAAGLACEWAFSRVHDAGATQIFIAVSVPRDSIVAPVMTAFLTQLAVLLLTALAGGIAAWWMGERMMVGPARAVLDKAHALAGGDLSARVRIDAHQPREMVQLGDAFDGMAEVLQTRQAELDEMLGSVEKQHALLDLIINNMAEGVVAADTEGRLLLFNAAARGLFTRVEHDQPLSGWTLGHELLDAATGEPLVAAARPLARAIRGENADLYEATARRAGQPDRVLSMNIRPLLDMEGALIGGLVVITDITERRLDADFAAAQEQVLELIAGGAPLARSLERVVQLIERRAPDSVCTILLRDGAHLRHAAGPGLPAEVAEALDGLPVAEGSGVCGTAAHRLQVVVVRDIATDPLTISLKDLAARHGLVSCWCAPVLGSEGEVLATFAIYHRTPYSPGPADHALVEVATRLVRLAVERANAEEALQGSETRFRELAENIQDVFYSFDPHSGRVLYVSPAYETLWGRSCASLLADPGSFAAGIHPDDRERALAMRAQGAARMSDLQYRVVRPDNSVRWVHDHSYPVLNAAGVVERVVGTTRDITPRKQADLDLLHNNRALQMLSRGNEALVRAEDEQQLLLEICRLAVNVGGYQMAWVGYAQEDVDRTVQPMAWAGQELGYLSEVSLTWAENDPRGTGPAGRVIRSGHVVVCEDLMAEGSGFYWQAHAFSRGYRSLIGLPLHDSTRTFGILVLFAPTVLKTRWEEVKLLQELAANLAYGIVNLRARAEQKRIEQAMRDANARLVEQASLLDRAQDAIIVRSLERPVITYWNKGAERLYGWTAAEAVGAPLHERMYADVRQFHKAMEDLLEHGEWTGELEQRARDGTALAVEGRWTLVRDATGEPTSVLAINTDIRDRKRARDQILRLNAELEHRVQQRTAQLLAANKEMEAFSYSVSHDLRTPLNAIDGFSHLLERSLGGAGDDKQKHFLTRIRVGVRHMGELIEGLLLLSQISRTSMRDEDVDMSALAHQVVATLRENHATRDVKAQVEEGLVARGDPRLLRQVLDNLMSNAWKFTAHQPQGIVTVGSEADAEGKPVFFVRDNGAGFDMAYASKLFGAFQRLHSPSDFPGTGIGLATVQRIVKRHAGRIWAESAPGRGATFYFTLGRDDLAG